MKQIVTGSLTLVAATLLCASAAAVQIGPEGRCEVGKNHESGKYAFCLHKAEVRLLKTQGTCSVTTTKKCYRDEDCPIMGESCQKDTTRYADAVTRCEGAYAARWTIMEQRAAEKSAICPDGLLQTEVKQVIDDCVANVATGLAGDGLEDCAGDLTICSDDLSTCEADLSQSQSDLSMCTGDLGDCTSDLGSCNGDLATCNAALGTCPTDLAACLAEPKGQRVRTGQTLCYAGGTVIPCALTGQDGELLMGLTVSFTDNGDGTITDDRTGLMWEKIADDGSIHDKDTEYTWADAFKRVQVLNGDATGCIAAGNPDACCSGAGTGVCSAYLGHTDWRLPNVNELQSLTNYGAVSPAVHAPFNTGCVAACTVLTCSCTESDSYWCATTYQSSPTNAWRVNFIAGLVNFLTKGGSSHVRAVRGGS